MGSKRLATAAFILYAQVRMSLGKHNVAKTFGVALYLMRGSNS